MTSFHALARVLSDAAALAWAMGCAPTRINPSGWYAAPVPLAPDRPAIAKAVRLNALMVETHQNLVSAGIADLTPAALWTGIVAGWGSHVRATLMARI